ncbi:MAG: cation-transporting P-type ATPase [Candidatus Verstraetearchaeota archaeon]|nr:cation-transporting P-type ATPase [Candidatus Verstraetearchaeota archaeon]
MGFLENPHSIPLEELERMLGTSPEGLPPEEAERRLAVYGRNVLEEERRSRLKLFLRQFKSVLIYVLILASAIALLLDKVEDFFVIVGIVLLNGSIGFWQEMKAEASIQSLKKMAESRVSVVRGGRTITIPSSELVPGDVVSVSEGDVVAADIRLFESNGLMVDESTITGESVPSSKDESRVLPPQTPPYEMSNMLFSGTTVVRGSGRGYVCKTGSGTYLASIAERAKEESPDSPLTRAVKEFFKRYVVLLVAVFASVGVAGVLQGREIGNLSYLLVAQMVSAVPEGLPLVITIVMVVGAVALSRKKTLTRHLPAVETLGSATVIASDKTGTITEGRLEVKEVYSVDPEMARLGAALCNDSDGKAGDPLDLALSRWVGEEYNQLREENRRVWSFPFDTKRRFMATANDVSGRRVLFVKGAFEELRKLSEGTDGDLENLERQQDGMASRGLRTIAIATGDFSEGRDPDGWRLRIVALVGFLDPPKEGVREAVITAKRAGVKVLMITGDHPLTAKAIAGSVGIFNEGERILTGIEVDGMDDESLYRALQESSVVARALPENKYRIVKVLQERGEIVAVTGDGVNDVPALKAADLGIAMGSGSEAAKSVAKMVILDSNLSIIVDAIKRGRVIADNIRKVIYYLLSTNMMQIVLLALSVFAGYPIPLLPIQILWINIVTDGVQDKFFPFADEEGDVMARCPRKPKEQFFDGVQVFRIGFFGAITGAAALLLFSHLLGAYGYELAVSITFTTVAAAQWFNGIQAQKEREPFFRGVKRSFRVNPYAYLGVLLGMTLQLAAVYLVPGVFGAIPLGMEHWQYVAAFSAFSFFVVEVRKLLEGKIFRERSCQPKIFLPVQTTKEL